MATLLQTMMITRILIVTLFVLAHNSGDAATITVGGGCTLIDAINTANTKNASFGSCVLSADDADTIRLPSASNQALNVVGETVDGPNGLPSISTEITIVGNGATITRQGNLPFRFFHVAASGNLTLENLTISNGMAAGMGRAGNGGAIFSLGILSLNRCRIIGNEALIRGGGIYQEATANASVNQSTLANNEAGDGGAIATISGILTISNSTVSNNTAQNDGGGIFSSGSTISLIHSTVSNNGTGSSGGGLALIDGSVTNLSNSIVANNPQGNDCAFFADQPIELGINWLEDDSCRNAVGSGDGDPNVGPLTNNGGSTETHSLLAGSGAINSADNDICLAAPINGRDQAGNARDSGACDLGALEQPSASFIVIPIKNKKAVVIGL